MLDYIDIVSASATERLHETAKRAVVRAPGLVGLTGPRSATRPRPQRSGVLDDSRFRNAAVLSIEGELWGDTPADAEAEFDAITLPMVESLDTPALLKWQRAGGGLALQATVKLAGDVKPPLEGVAAMLTYQAQFLAADPRAYSQTLTRATSATLSGTGGGKVYPYTYPYTFAPSSGGDAFVTNAGKVKTPCVFTIYGECAAPRLRLASTGETITFRGTIGAGNFLVVDLTGRTPQVFLNGVTPRLSMVDFAATTWWELPPGAQTVQLLADSFDADARVDVQFRAAYPL